MLSSQTLSLFAYNKSVSLQYQRRHTEQYLFVKHFRNNLKKKRKQLFDFPQTAPLQNIKYENSNVHSGSVMEEIQPVFLGCDEDD